MKANHYTFSAQKANKQYISIETLFHVEKDVVEVQLPAWRPGRYQLGNFAKNVKNFRVTSENGGQLPFQKISKDCWSIETKGTKSIRVKYSFYANELNAGATFLDATQLYVNPVNCCAYLVGKEDTPCSVELKIPTSWQVACSMQKDANGFLQAANFDELVDSPFIASANLQRKSYEVKNTTFHLWFNGEVKPDWDKLLKDFKAFSEKQIEKFTEFPTEEYHFLFQILPYKTYHGVEHSKSTVITLGPSYAVFEDFYTELLGVSSHELYHTWNVKAIRPIELFPYDFSKENYSQLGYICEGVTTYMGDLFLYKSKVFDLQQYFKELTARMQVHFDNHARFNYSVAASSFDTWLDGYEKGAPNRKVSIYTEGCLLAFVADVMLLRATKNKYGLDEVMKRLYFNYALKNKGVSEENYKKELESVGGISFDDYFENYIHGTNSYESILVEALEYLGIVLTHQPAKEYSKAKLGFKTLKSEVHPKVKAMYPGGPAELGGLMLEDEIIGLNGITIHKNLEEWLRYFKDEEKEFLVNRSGRLLTIILPEVNRTFYNTYGLKKVKSPDKNQKNAFGAWSK